MKMRMIGAAIGVPAALLIGGCSDDESWRTTAAEGACEDSVKAQLKDPDSADFDGVDVVDNGDGTYSVTGRVNAENSFGGMTGFQDFECAARDDGDNVTGRATLLG
ncbi:hypothetical protein PP487_gp16 [Gordonia phage Herod]|nr:hypothetical protein SEA_BAXTERFOX_15 [Gordonia phage BaxterFox]YP_009301377.1 hypothetical protein SEA_KITA_16 [Gordonia phage Kita]YP_009304346.1 hypothetical protein SEA_YEEZY_17 [Gordonia phage Yeezy]YP_010652799.1 lipoprotein [Gordonia phage Bosnia]YP_010652881.1 hypothetical protein PP487_gp16 [Gordonia phage Herod]YP_010653126.1 hypothetical protein PP490_gp16 [Gordonia phage Maridalia]YP_010653209.1 hypothetical protein PP491_gp16 [Gordonia phage BoyNamedSue]AOE43894.1 hypothetica